MKKRFLKPIKFIEKYKNKEVEIEIIKVENFKYNTNYVVILYCNNDYTKIFSNSSYISTSVFTNYVGIYKVYSTFCLYRKNKKIVACYLNSCNQLRINETILLGTVNILIDLGVPLL